MPQLFYGLRRHYVVIPSLGLAYGRVPKSANSTIKRLLARAAGLEEAFGGTGYSKDRNWRDKAPEAYFLSAKAMRRAHPDVLVFTFVREPLARLASCYRSKIVRAPAVPKGLKREGLTKDTTFAEFARHVAGRSDRRSNIHYRAQSAILTDRGALVPEFVGRFETLEADWERLRETLRARNGVELPSLPPRGGGPARPPVAQAGDFFDGDEALMDRLRRRYADDYRLFYPELIGQGGG